MTEKKKKIDLKWLIAPVAIFFIVFVLPVSAYLGYEKLYGGKIYPGVYLGEIDLAGYDSEAAKHELNKRIDKLSQTGIPFIYHNQETVLYPLIASLEGDIAREVIVFDTESTINNLLNYGRVGSFLKRLQNKIAALIKPQRHTILFAVNREELETFFLSNFNHFATPAQNARLEYSQENHWDPIVFNIKEESYGQVLNIEAAEQELKRGLSSLDITPIKIKANIDYPKIYKKEVLNVNSIARSIINMSPLSLSYGWRNWLVYKSDILNWLIIKDNFSTSSSEKYIVGFDYKKVSNYLSGAIAPDIDKKPIDAKFEIKDGKVNEFQASQDGIGLAIEKNTKIIEKQVVLFGQNDIELTVEETKSEVDTAEINNYGIKEIIGIGHSNFSGSPSNRRHNIAIGAAAVNGTLIAPDEEFSLNKVLGEVNADTGYLPELVIKEGRTIPEYGGGLCQIGTTAFRGTTASGLPVTMRRNHSYRVGYYEPAGTDATIYSPWPDYKFKNDTGNHILIQSRIEGNDLYFDFWGTNDGRIATQTYPVIYNIVRPAPTKIIETTDLEPGVKRCTESAHNGADAYIDYTVTYPDGKIEEIRFSSHYVPWRAVCLVGVDALSTTTEEIVEQ